MLGRLPFVKPDPFLALSGLFILQISKVPIWLLKLDELEVTNCDLKFITS